MRRKSPPPRPAATLPSLTLILFSLLTTTTTTTTTSSLSTITSSLSTNASSQQLQFLKCLFLTSPTPIPTTNPLLTPSLSSPYQPIFVLHPNTFDHVEATVKCAKAHHLQIRTRSGGHDYANLSSVSLSVKPFLVLDLANLRAITVAHDRTNLAMWVQAGATLGELYHAILTHAPNHAFPAGLCPTVGVGGHISGGGFGLLVRKFGLAADNVLDALIVDSKGRILSRETMGEDLFWAIRGGGAASFCIVLSWKLMIHPVPEIVTIFNIHKTHDERAIALIHKWNLIAYKLPRNLFIRVLLQRLPAKKGGTAITTTFQSLYLGNYSKLKGAMNQWFPELRFSQSDAMEMSWRQAVLFFSGYKNATSIDVLLDRVNKDHLGFKAKSDYLTRPMPKRGLQGLWEWMEKEEKPFVIIDPYGGKVAEIAEDETPFPHRAGSLYNIQYILKWEGEGAEEKKKHEEWIWGLYNHMERYVSKKPRAAYLNYRDLDLGINGRFGGYEEARVWGEKYFKGNFRRLAMVKAEVDSGDFFWNEQSIPPLRP
ncbi:hypothetical protein AMTR_s00032p00227150 [Amborella trichopoda]|uniref:FAD-binding PCMH-type domain-containing protein n=2 Tax=Amborella trichopoda TaxID=13333 RepID=U5D0T0_AMBTC|nr:hypothetical protein AMTR_s00032p00227150 [Amborella trichopoda]